MSTPLSFDDPFVVTPAMREQFQRDGFIRIKNVLSADEIDRIRPVVDEVVTEAQKTYPSLDADGFYHKQFVQVSASWKASPAMKAIAFSKRFAKMATELMGARGVRLYHDQSLYKIPGSSRTFHHQDLSYWPLATEKACALWIPLQAVTMEMGPLGFYRGSHRIPYRSPDVITPDGEEKMVEHLKANGCAASWEPYELGEVSFHFGWTCHAALANTTSVVRKVHTINYFEDGTVAAEPLPQQELDWKLFLRKAKIGEPIASRHNPLLWENGA